MEITEDIVFKYFPELDSIQRKQISILGELYFDWNSKINVISRKDIDKLYLHHILHSLAIAKFTQFKPGTQVMDLGTGGGFPGIPLAIFFPEVEFHLIDGIAKKLKVVSSVAQSLDLENVRAQQLRAEENKEKYDFVVNRAVAKIDKLWDWVKPLVRSKQKNALPNGLLTLKGGDLNEELSLLPRGNYHEQIPISDYFSEDFFEQKFLIYVQR